MIRLILWTALAGLAAVSSGVPQGYYQPATSPQIQAIADNPPKVCTRVHIYFLIINILSDSKTQEKLSIVSFESNVGSSSSLGLISLFNY